MSTRAAAPLLAVFVLASVTAASARAQSTDGVTAVLEAMQDALARSDAEAYRGLLLPDLTSAQTDGLVAMTVESGVTRAVVRERDRFALAAAPHDRGVRSIVEIFTEQGNRGRILTLRIDIRRGDSGAAADRWWIAGQELVTQVEGLYRLSLNRNRQFTVRNLTIIAEDLTLVVPTGSAFVAEVREGITALVLLGEGMMRFSPKPEAERGQVRIFTGRSDVLETAFTAAFVRFSPGDFEQRVSKGLFPVDRVDARAVQRAAEIFDDEVVKSFGLDLNDLSRDTWSLVPSFGDFLAEIRTRRYSTLTYARSANEPEDITLFDRARHRNIAVYASESKLASRGRDYDEDALVDYDVLAYDMDVQFAPARDWVQGTTRLSLRVRSFALNTLTLHLAESLTVHSVVSEQYGRLLAIRVKGQNSVLLSMPAAVPQDSVLRLTVEYAGPLQSQKLDREALALAQEGRHPFIPADSPLIEPERRWVYSTRSYWYPQAEVSDYATAIIRIRVPWEYDVIASGDPSPANPVRIEPPQPGVVPLKEFSFSAGQPLRYLACMVTRLQNVTSASVQVPAPRPPPTVSQTVSLLTHPANGSTPTSGGQTGVRYDLLDLAVVANPRQAARGRALIGQMRDVMQLYMSILGDTPYATFTLAAVDSDLPGGHSPAYFALLNQPLPTTPFSWRNDPVYFDKFPQFFIAHELAHQFWGQAVGWKNYHEQWLSEGFAQYFAALYAERSRGPALLHEILRQMRRSALAANDQGPVSLGYRLGHIKGDSRVFRSIVYNKGALVLHMLRRLIGDEAFFDGLRSFYASSRFRKVGTEEVRRTFEAVSGRSLERFFERWIYSAAVPEVRWRHAVESAATTDGTPAAGQLLLSFEQSPDVFDLPVTVTLTYANGGTETSVLVLSERTVQHRLRLKGQLRDVTVNGDEAALARFTRP